MTSYEHKVKNIYLGSPYKEGTPIIPGDYTLLRGPCDEGFHVPLKEEWQAITNITISVANAIDGLYFPLIGRLDREGAKENTDKGYYWSSTANAFGIPVYYINTGSTSTSSHWRSSGIPIRAFRNTPIIPDENRTENIQGKVRYNSDLGLLSVLVGTNQYVTMQDKNVGATVVFHRGDTKDETHCGKYFQRGNDYGFPYSGPTNKSPTQVDTSNYGPNNHYNSDTFINGNNDRSNPQNDNLRGYTDFNS